MIQILSSGIKQVGANAFTQPIQICNMTTKNLYHSHSCPVSGRQRTRVRTRSATSSGTVHQQQSARSEIRYSHAGTTHVPRTSASLGSQSSFTTQVRSSSSRCIRGKFLARYYNTVLCACLVFNHANHVFENAIVRLVIYKMSVSLRLQTLHMYMSHEKPACIKC